MFWVCLGAYWGVVSLFWVYLVCFKCFGWVWMCVGSFIWVCVGCSVCVLVWFECILLWDVFGVFEWVLGCFGCVLAVLSFWVSFAGSWRCFECILDVFSVFELCWMSFVGISECFECLGCFQHDLGVWVSFMDILRWCGVFWASFWIYLGVLWSVLWMFKCV